MFPYDFEEFLQANSIDIDEKNAKYKYFETRKRETAALVQIAKRYEINRFLIITKDEEKTITENEMEISVIPVWKWLH